jgi:hypothetical protein
LALAQTQYKKQFIKQPPLITLPDTNKVKNDKTIENKRQLDKKNRLNEKLKLLKNFNSDFYECVSSNISYFYLKEQIEDFPELLFMVFSKGNFDSNFNDCSLVELLHPNARKI